MTDLEQRLAATFEELAAEAPSRSRPVGLRAQPGRTTVALAPAGGRGRCRRGWRPGP